MNNYDVLRGSIIKFGCATLAESQALLAVLGAYVTFPFSTFASEIPLLFQSHVSFFFSLK